jgi:Ca-activated chloride channel family protein
MTIEFSRPDLLYALLALPVWALLVWPRAGRGVLFTRGSATPRRAPLAWAPAAFVLVAPKILTGAALASLIVALAGPQQVEVVRDTMLEGRGIGLVVDLSSSMLAEDMGDNQSRISLAREAAVRFARRRVYDELSLVAFGSEALTRVPPTTDRELIVQGVESLEIQLVRDGTDISGAILTSVSRLLESERQPRVVVLLTDGAHNGPDIPPLVTARAAAAVDVRIHAISILAPTDANVGLAGSIVRDRFGAERETVLQGLADITGGRYFRAASAAALDSIYDEIDRIETPRPKVLESEVRHPLAAWFFLLGLVLLAVDALLRGSRWGIVH